MIKVESSLLLALTLTSGLGSGTSKVFLAISTLESLSFGLVLAVTLVGLTEVQNVAETELLLGELSKVSSVRLGLVLFLSGLGSSFLGGCSGLLESLTLTVDWWRNGGIPSLCFLVLGNSLASYLVVELGGARLLVAPTMSSLLCVIARTSNKLVWHKHLLLLCE